MHTRQEWTTYHSKLIFIAHHGLLGCLYVKGSLLTEVGLCQKYII